MSDKNQHLSDQEILLAMEGELSSRRVAEVHKHLSICEACRARMEAMQTTITDFVQLHHHRLDPQLPSTARSRARLKAQLAELSSMSRLSRWARLFGFAFGSNGLAYISAGLLALALGAWGVYHRNLRDESAPTFAQLKPATIPNPTLTPGAVRPVTVKDVCTEQFGDENPAIPISQQRRVFQEYGMANARPENYELDYLITPELGGADDIRNLWPEPHSSTAWNSYVKDDLEAHLYQLVCEGKLDLPTAQHDIATDWISAYKKYFHTDRPLAKHLNQNSNDHQGPRT